MECSYFQSNLRGDSFDLSDKMGEYNVDFCQALDKRCFSSFWRTATQKNGWIFCTSVFHIIKSMYIFRDPAFFDVLDRNLNQNPSTAWGSGDHLWNLKKIPRSHQFIWPIWICTIWEAFSIFSDRDNLSPRVCGHLC